MGRLLIEAVACYGQRKGSQPDNKTTRKAPNFHVSSLWFASVCWARNVCGKDSSITCGDFGRVFISFELN